MILGVCPNPCIDITIPIKNVRLREINRADCATTTYSGKAINALKALNVLGEYCVASGFMFENDKDAFCDDLGRHNIDSAFVNLLGDVRKNVKLVEPHGQLTEINTKSGNITDDDKKALLNKVAALSQKAKSVIISGSLPAACDDDYYGELVSVINHKAIKIVDTQDEMLLSTLKYGVDLIKPNKFELECIENRTLTSATEMIAACKKLLKAGAKNVLLSLGEKGAIWCNEKVSLFANSPKVIVRSPVGAGDSMIGVCAKLLSVTDDPREILRYAVAAGAASVMTDGTNPFNIDDLKSLYKKIVVGTI